MDYKLVTTREGIVSYLSKITDLSVFDTELTGLKIDDLLLGVAFYDRETYPIFVPLDYIFTERGIPISVLRSALQEVEYHKKPIIAHNAKFDITVFKFNNLPVPVVQEDTAAMVHVYDSNLEKKLETRVKKDLKVNKKTFEEIVGKKWAKIDWVKEGNSLLDVMAEYACEDVLYESRLYDYYLTKLEEENLLNVYRKIEVPICDVLSSMRVAGVLIDLDKLSGIGDKLSSGMEKLKSDIYQEAGCIFNINSGKQMAEVLFGKMGLPPIKKTKGGALSTDSGTMEELKIQGYKIAEYLDNYSKLQKLDSGYVKSIPRFIDFDGKLRCDFNSTGTKCITRNSVVPTSRGMIRISDATAKDVIVNKNGELEQADGLFKFKKKPTIKVSTMLGFDIEGTYNHRIISVDSEGKHDWSTLDSLQVKQKVKIPFRYNVFSSVNQQIEYTELPINTCSKPIKLPKVMTPELAEFIGMYNADGSIHDSNGSYTIRLSTTKETVIKRFIYLCKLLFDRDVEYNPKQENVCLTTIQLKPFIESLGLVKRCENKTIPDCVLLSNRDCVISYLRGILLDSHVVNDDNLKKSYLKITVSNYDHANLLQSILMNLGYVASKTKVDKVSWSICIYREDAKRFLELVKPFKVFISIKHLTWKKRNYKVYSNYIEVPITSITYAVKDVYDYHIPGTHSFIANCLINHNTGRFSSSNPNLQNQPNNDEYPIRECFIAEEGRQLFALDYSQIELRIMGHMAQDKRFIQAFNNGEDIHQKVADDLGISRKQSKTINFGVLYGMGSDSLAWQLGTKVRQAEEIIHGYHRTYEGFARWKTRVEQEAIKTGQVRNMFGRIRRIPEAQERNSFYRGQGLRRAVNTAIQGSAADLIKLAMVKLLRRFKEENLDARMLLQVHDELLCDAPIKQVCDAYDITSEVMEQVVTLSVPLIADGKIINHWGQMKDDNFLSLYDSIKNNTYRKPIKNNNQENLIPLWLI